MRPNPPVPTALGCACSVSTKILSRALHPDGLPRGFLNQPSLPIQSALISRIVQM
ncbi:hypothetical protein BDV23DRAFT_165480 [Aspergillus alliaceus]|uniref:Uncharacterized protein n=1 Tax=Petromyces alliaceus TaxID=209559 RepID=A0A5N7BTG0_PETAA|nr:hypothetical protein BDV23DRAFT_165480 [Aspergillus alliaceus]